MSARGRLEQGLLWLERATAAVAGTVLALMVALLAFGPVQAALEFGRPIQWLTEISEYGLLQLALLGGALALRRGAHPALDGFLERLPVGPRRVLAATRDVATAALGVLLLVLGTGYVLASHANGGPLDTIALPKWPFYLCYPIGGLLIVAFSVGRMAGVDPDLEADR